MIYLCFYETVRFLIFKLVFMLFIYRKSIYDPIFYNISSIIDSITSTLLKNTFDELFTNTISILKHTPLNDLIAN